MNAVTEQQAKLLLETIAAWESLTESKLESEAGAIKWWTCEENMSLREAFKQDGSGVTALLLLNAYAQNFAANLSFTLKDLAEDPESVLAKAKDLKKIRASLNAPEFKGIISSFSDYIAGAVEAYGCRTPEVEKLIHSSEELAFIRRDAYRAAATLREDVFNFGPTDPAPMKYNPGVYLFWDINALIRLLGATKDSGVTLALVENTEEITASHFAFAIRNGSNLILLSDRPRFDNPGQAIAQASRGHCRQLAERMQKLRFPYDLMGAWLDSKGKAHARMPGAQTVAPYQKEAIKLAELHVLPPDCILWLSMIFPLLEQRYWKNAIPARALSYTGEMIQKPLALTEGCAALITTQYQPLQFPTLKVPDVATAAVAGEFRVRQTRQNEWMEKRYAAEVNPDILNLTKTTNAPLLISGDLPPAKDPNGWLPSLAGEGKERKHRLARMQPDYWGTQAELQHTHIWVARKNLATAVEGLARREFERTHEEVEKWYRQALIKNKEFWQRGIAVGELLLPSLPRKEDGFFTVEGHPAKREMRNRLHFCWRDEASANLHFYVFHGNHFHNGYSRRHDAFWDWGNPAILGRDRAEISADCPEAISALCGCKVEELPELLHHWFARKAYIGNTILDDIDPMEAIKNPWIEGFTPNLLVRFSRPTINQWQKQYQLPVRRLWAKDHPAK